MKTIVLVLLLASVAAAADQPRFARRFVSANGAYELRLLSQYAPATDWALVETSTGKTLYKVSASLGPRTTLVSDDGAYVAAVNDFAELSPSPDVEVLAFYANGRLTKRYTLADLVPDQTLVSRSVSHFTWFFYNGRLALSPDLELDLVTYDLTRFEFDVRSGEVVSRKIDQPIGDGIYAYGSITEIGPRRYRMEICRVLRGAKPEGRYVEFEAEKGDVEARVSSAIIIEHGRGRAVSAERSLVLSTECDDAYRAVPAKPSK